MSIQQLAEAFRQADQFLDDVEGLELVRAGDWSQDGKYQHCETIVRFDGALYAVQQSRTGSYHSDWHYGDTLFYPVERREETKVIVTYVVAGKSVEVAARW